MIMKKLTIKEINAELSSITEETDPFIIALEQDERAGAQKALNKWRKFQLQQTELLRKYKEMSVFEEQAELAGAHRIAGVDEVGRGPLAGPVMAAAVILDPDKPIFGLDDSKKLSDKKKNELYDQILTKAIAVSSAIIEADEIDRINIYQASKRAMEKVVEQLSIPADYLLVDAMTIGNNLPQDKLIKGDARSVSIAAASIVAKVERDRLMEEYGQKYPGYGFEKNAGYGTKQHLEGLDLYGVTPIHRMTFSPVQSRL